MNPLFLRRRPWSTFDETIESRGPQLKGLASSFAFVSDFVGLVVIFSLVTVPLVTLVIPTAKVLKDDAGLQLATNAMQIGMVVFYMVTDNRLPVSSMTF